MNRGTRRPRAGCFAWGFFLLDPAPGQSGRFLLSNPCSSGDALQRKGVAMRFVLLLVLGLAASRSWALYPDQLEATVR